MKQKDLAEKRFLAYNDVFADLLNVIYFKGQTVIKPNELKEATELTQFKGDDGKLKEQVRDLAKFWEKEGMVFAFFGVENQTKEEKNMILRVMGYDGATYHKQKDNKKIYPVQTVVVYWGKEKWKAPLSLRERIDVDGEMKELITDYSYKLIEVSRLSEDVRKKFKSDFKYVAEILSMGADYEPTNEEVSHPEGMLELLGTILGDERFTEIIGKPDTEKEGRKVKMCELLDKIENRGYDRGVNEGVKFGKIEGKIEGEAKTSSLFLALLKEGKTAEALKASEDEGYRKKLFEIYGL